MPAPCRFTLISSQTHKTNDTHNKRHIYANIKHHHVSKYIEDKMKYISDTCYIGHTYTHTHNMRFLNVHHQKSYFAHHLCGATWRLEHFVHTDALIIIIRIWEVKSRETNKRYLSFLLCRCRHHHRLHNNDHWHVAVV